MTRNKFNRILKDIIEKYGDVVVVKVYDYYKSRLILKDGEESSDNVLETILLSDYINNDKVVPNREEIKHIESIAKGEVGPYLQPVEIEESKQLYDSDEQVILRKKEKEKFQQLLGTYIPFTLKEPYLNLTDFGKYTRQSYSPKEYGMYLSNK